MKEIRPKPKRQKYPIKNKIPIGTLVQYKHGDFLYIILGYEWLKGTYDDYEKYNVFNIETGTYFLLPFSSPNDCEIL